MRIVPLPFRAGGGLVALPCVAPHPPPPTHPPLTHPCLLPRPSRTAKPRSPVTRTEHIRACACQLLLLVSLSQ